MSGTKSLIAVLLIIIVGGLLIAGMTFANYRFSQENPGGNDFLARWMGARYWLVNGISPYDERVSEASQLMIYGHLADPSLGEDKNHFVYPLTSMIFFGPFGLIEYLPARALWMTFIELSLIALFIVSIQLSGWKVRPWKVGLLLLFSLLWYHSARTIILGQFAAINALLLTLGLLLIARKQYYVAGFLLSLSISKPQMSVLLLLYVIIWAISVRNWELWWGVITGALIQIGVSIVLMPDWPLQMIRQVLDYPSYTPIGEPLSIIANAMPALSKPVSIFLHTIFIVYLGYEWIISLGKKPRHFVWTAMLTLAVTNLVIFRTATTNYVMLLPVLFYIFTISEIRWRAAGHLFVWLSLIILLVGLWILFFITVEGNQEQPIMFLPLPFFCLFGLWWVRWWAISPPRLFINEMSQELVE